MLKTNTIKNMSKILGLDLGTSSIGWAIIDDENEKIIKTGVRIFPEGVVDLGQGDKEKSRNATRRDNRGARRQFFRRKLRKKFLLKILNSNGLIPKSNADLNDWYKLPPYQLRQKALTNKIELEELGRVFYHMIQRRGFQSNSRKQQLDEKSPIYLGNAKEGKVGIAETKEQIENYATLGDYLATLNPHGTRQRNRYTTRKMYIDEFEKIWEAQAQYHKELTEELKHKIGGIDNHSEKNGALFHQRPLRSQKYLLGNCSFEKNKTKSPISAIFFEKYRAWSFVNNIICNGEHLSYNERKDIVELKLFRVDKVKFKALRKVINKQSDNFKFNFKDDETISGCHTINQLSKFQYNGQHWNTLTQKQQDEIWPVVLEFDDIEKLKSYAIEKWGFAEIEAEKIAKLNLKDGYASLSRKAINNILPFLMLEEHFTLDVAVALGGVKNAFGNQFENLSDEQKELIITTVSDIAKNGEVGGYITKLKQFLIENFEFNSKQISKLYHHSAKIEETPTVAKLPKGKDADKRIINIKNPVVVTALFELRKVVNELLTTYGKFDEIKVEMARNLKASKSQRKQIIYEQRANETKNENAVKELRDLKIRITHDNILKYKLWQECNRICPFTGKQISVTQLFETGEVQIEHIQPYSRSLNDSYMNKTLCFADENRAKGNQTPFEYYGKDEKNWEIVKQRVLSNFYDTKEHPKRYKKFLHFVKEKLEEDFVTRQLNDTRYLSKEAKNYLAQIVPSNNIITPTGAVTAKLRQFWGFNQLIGETKNKERTDHRHHAIDAIVVALTKRQYINEMSKFNRYNKVANPNKFPLPWELIWQDAQNAVNQILVSHKKNNRVITTKKTTVTKNGKKYINTGIAARGQLHKETVFGQYIGKDEKGKEIKQYHVRKAVTEFKDRKQLGKIVDKATFQLIENKIIGLGGYVGAKQEIPKTFFVPDEKGNLLYMPNNNGANIPIKKVRIKEEIGNAVKLKDTNQWVNPRNNHHVLIYRDNNDNLQEQVITFWEAVERKKDKQDVFQLPLNGKEIITTLQINDMFLLGLIEEEINWDDKQQLQQHLYRVQKLSNSNYMFRHSLASTLNNKKEEIHIRSLGKLESINPIKVKISSSGKMSKLS